MANRERGEYRLVARHRSYVLRLTVEACCELQDRTNRALTEVIAGINAGQATDIRGLIWAALQDRHGHEMPTLEDAGRFIDESGGLVAIVPHVVALVALNEDDRPTQRRNASGPAANGAAVNPWRRLYMDARRAGVSPSEFWSLSLKELWRELAGYEEQREHEVECDRIQAWYTAALSRSERMPPLMQFIRRRPQAQTPQEMEAVINVLRQMYPNSRHAH